MLAGCASAPQVKVAAEVFDPKAAKSRSVAVVEDLYMEDSAEAGKLAGLIRKQLTSNGFKVRDEESEADLVVLPTIERSKPTAASPAPLPRVWRSFDLSYGLGKVSMMESQNAFRNLGFELDSAPPPEQLKAGLIVTAVTRDAWFKADQQDKAEIPRVWRIIAVTPLNKEDVTPRLVEAVGAKLNEVARGEIKKAENPGSPPAAPSRKKQPR